jgi:hypothetical protein
MVTGLVHLYHVEPWYMYKHRPGGGAATSLVDPRAAWKAQSQISPNLGGSHLKPCLLTHVLSHVQQVNSPRRADTLNRDP